MLITPRGLRVFTTFGCMSSHPRGISGGRGVWGLLLSSKQFATDLHGLGLERVFAAAFLFGPRHGVVVRWWKRQSRTNRVRRENTLKSIYRVLEDRNFQGEAVSLRELAELRHESLEQARKQSQELRRGGFATTHKMELSFLLTPGGCSAPCEIVRNIVLWELI